METKATPVRVRNVLSFDYALKRLLRLSKRQQLLFDSDAERRSYDRAERSRNPPTMLAFSAVFW
ncbi:MAG: hypothetical protein LBS63_03790 [Prevotellaceae bacterium]|jgi:hypothetical protein|nr:hypothetical protein [Prevotellaceae bacterium]